MAKNIQSGINANFQNGIFSSGAPVAEDYKGSFKDAFEGKNSIFHKMMIGGKIPLDMANMWGYSLAGSAKIMQNAANGNGVSVTLNDKIWAAKSDEEKGAMLSAAVTMHTVGENILLLADDVPTKRFIDGKAEHGLDVFLRSITNFDNYSFLLREADAVMDERREGCEELDEIKNVLSVNPSGDNRREEGRGFMIDGMTYFGRGELYDYLTAAGCDLGTKQEFLSRFDVADSDNKSIQVRKGEYLIDRSEIMAASYRGKEILEMISPEVAAALSDFIGSQDITKANGEDIDREKIKDILTGNGISADGIKTVANAYRSAVSKEFGLQSWRGNDNLVDNAYSHVREHVDAIWDKAKACIGNADEQAKVRIALDRFGEDNTTVKEKKEALGELDSALQGAHITFSHEKIETVDRELKVTVADILQIEAKIRDYDNIDKPYVPNNDVDKQEKKIDLSKLSTGAAAAVAVIVSDDFRDWLKDRTTAHNGKLRVDSGTDGKNRADYSKAIWGIEVLAGKTPGNVESAISYIESAYKEASRTGQYNDYIGGKHGDIAVLRYEIEHYNPDKGTRVQDTDQELEDKQKAANDILSGSRVRIPDLNTDDYRRHLVEAYGKDGEKAGHNLDYAIGRLSLAVVYGSKEETEKWAKEVKQLRDGAEVRDEYDSRPENEFERRAAIVLYDADGRKTRYAEVSKDFFGAVALYRAAKEGYGQTIEVNGREKRINAYDVVTAFNAVWQSNIVASIGNRANHGLYKSVERLESTKISKEDFSKFLERYFDQKHQIFGGNKTSDEFKGKIDAYREKAEDYYRDKIADPSERKQTVDSFISDFIDAKDKIDGDRQADVNDFLEKWSGPLAEIYKDIDDSKNPEDIDKEKEKIMTDKEQAVVAQIKGLKDKYGGRIDPKDTFQAYAIFSALRGARKNGVGIDIRNIHGEVIRDKPVTRWDVFCSFIKFLNTDIFYTLAKGTFDKIEAAYEKGQREEVKKLIGDTVDAFGKTDVGHGFLTEFEADSIVSKDEKYVKVDDKEHAVQRVENLGAGDKKYSFGEYGSDYVIARNGALVESRVTDEDRGVVRVEKYDGERRASMVEIRTQDGAVTKEARAIPDSKGEVQIEYGSEKSSIAIKGTDGKDRVSSLERDNTGALIERTENNGEVRVRTVENSDGKIDLGRYAKDFSEEKETWSSTFEKGSSVSKEENRIIVDDKVRNVTAKENTDDGKIYRFGSEDKGEYLKVDLSGAKVEQKTYSEEKGFEIIKFSGEKGNEKPVDIDRRNDKGEKIERTVERSDGGRIVVQYKDGEPIKISVFDKNDRLERESYIERVNPQEDNARDVAIGKDVSQENAGVVDGVDHNGTESGAEKNEEIKPVGNGNDGKVEQPSADTDSKNTEIGHLEKARAEISKTDCNVDIAKEHLTSAGSKAEKSDWISLGDKYNANDNTKEALVCWIKGGLSEKDFNPKIEREHPGIIKEAYAAAARDEMKREDCDANKAKEWLDAAGDKAEKEDYDKLNEIISNEREDIARDDDKVEHSGTQTPVDTNSQQAEIKNEKVDNGSDEKKGPGDSITSYIEKYIDNSGKVHTREISLSESQGKNDININSYAEDLRNGKERWDYEKGHVVNKEESKIDIGGREFDIKQVNDLGDGEKRYSLSKGGDEYAIVKDGKDITEYRIAKLQVIDFDTKDIHTVFEVLKTIQDNGEKITVNYLDRDHVTVHMESGRDTEISKNNQGVWVEIGQDQGAPFKSRELKDVGSKIGFDIDKYIDRYSSRTVEIAGERFEYRDKMTDADGNVVYKMRDGDYVKTDAYNNKIETSKMEDTLRGKTQHISEFDNGPVKEERWIGETFERRVYNDDKGHRNDVTTNDGSVTKNVDIGSWRVSVTTVDGEFSYGSVKGTDGAFFKEYIINDQGQIVERTAIRDEVTTTLSPDGFSERVVGDKDGFDSDTIFEAAEFTTRFQDQGVIIDEYNNRVAISVDGEYKEREILDVQDVDGKTRYVLSDNPESLQYLDVAKDDNGKTEKINGYSIEESGRSVTVNDRGDKIEAERRDDGTEHKKASIGEWVVETNYKDGEFVGGSVYDKNGELFRDYRVDGDKNVIERTMVNGADEKVVGLADTFDDDAVIFDSCASMTRIEDKGIVIDENNKEMFVEVNGRPEAHKIEDIQEVGEKTRYVLEGKQYVEVTKDEYGNVEKVNAVAIENDGKLVTNDFDNNARIEAFKDNFGREHKVTYSDNNQSIESILIEARDGNLYNLEINRSGDDITGGQITNTETGEVVKIIDVDQNSGDVLLKGVTYNEEFGVVIPDEDRVTKVGAKDNYDDAVIIAAFEEDVEPKREEKGVTNDEHVDEKSKLVTYEEFKNMSSDDIEQIPKNEREIVIDQHDSVQANGGEVSEDNSAEDVKVSIHDYIDHLSDLVQDYVELGDGEEKTALADEISAKFEFLIDAIMNAGEHYQNGDYMRIEEFGDANIDFQSFDSVLDWTYNAVRDDAYQDISTHYGEQIAELDMKNFPESFEDFKSQFSLGTMPEPTQTIPEGLTFEIPVVEVQNGEVKIDNEALRDNIVNALQVLDFSTDGMLEKVADFVEDALEKRFNGEDVSLDAEGAIPNEMQEYSDLIKGLFDRGVEVMTSDSHDPVATSQPATVDESHSNDIPVAAEDSAQGLGEQEVQIQQQDIPGVEAQEEPPQQDVEAPQNEDAAEMAQRGQDNAKSDQVESKPMTRDEMDAQMAIKAKETERELNDFDAGGNRD